MTSFLNAAAQKMKVPDVKMTSQLLIKILYKMNKEALKKSLDKSEFISDPENMEALMVEADKHLAAAFPGKTVSPQAVVGMANLMLYFEDGAELPDEEPQ